MEGARGRPTDRCGTRLAGDAAAGEGRRWSAGATEGTRGRGQGEAAKGTTREGPTGWATEGRGRRGGARASPRLMRERGRRRSAE